MTLMADLIDALVRVQTVSTFIVALLIIVTVHELGHYLVGRACGIHATVFSLGFGKPLVKRTDKRGTVWQIAMIPLGGYVKFLGDSDGASARADDATMAALSTSEKRLTLHGAPLWARALTVAAGPVFNILFTILVLAASLNYYGIALDQPVVGTLRDLPGAGQGLQPGDKVLAVAGQPTPDQKAYFGIVTELPAAAEVTYHVERGGKEMDVQDAHPMPPLVLDVAPKSAALDAGLRAGDVVTSLDGVAITTFNQLPAMIEAKNGASVDLQVWRNGQTHDVTLTPRKRDMPDGKGGFITRWLIGLSRGSLFEPAVRAPGVWETASLSVRQTWVMTTTNISGIGHILSGAISACNLSGPIGMAEVIGQAARSGLDQFFQMLAVVSLGIGLMNLFPIPVLDGGHLVFHVYEAVMRRPPSKFALQLLTSIGLGILLFLMIFAIKNDLTCQ